MSWGTILEAVTQAIGIVLVLGGCFFVVTGAVGILRFPDLYTRLHPAGLVDALASPLVLVGLAFLAGASLTAVKLLLLVVFLLITSPAATHALSKAAYDRGLKPVEGPFPQADTAGRPRR